VKEDATMDDKEALHDMIFNLLCCCMCVDMKIHANEVYAINTILKEMEVPWKSSEIKNRVKAFIESVQSHGFHYVLENTFDQIEEWDYPDEGKALLDCIDRMIDADGHIRQSELDIKEKFRAAFSRKTTPGHRDFRISPKTAEVKKKSSGVDAH